MKGYITYDGDRPVRFTGEELGSATTFAGKSTPRWTEISIYRTEGGTYVLHIIGVSNVFHSDTCSRTTKGVKFNSLEEASEFLDTDHAWVSCSACHPHADETPVWAEVDQHTTFACDTATDLVNRMRLTRHGGVGRMSKVATRALTSASFSDHAIFEAAQVPIDVK